MMSSLDMESGATLVSAASVVGTARTPRLDPSTEAEHFPPLKLHRNRDSVSTTYTLATETGTRARVTSSPFLFPLPPPLRLPVSRTEGVKKSTEAEDIRDSADSESPGSFKTARVSWSDWVEGQKRFSKEIGHVHGSPIWPSGDCSFSRSNTLEECDEEDGFSIPPKRLENAANGNVAKPDSMKERKTSSLPDEQCHITTPIASRDQIGYTTTLRSSPVSSLSGIQGQRCSRRRNRAIRLNTSHLFLTKSAPPSPTFPPRPVEILPLRRAVTTLSAHVGTRSLSSIADFGPRSSTSLKITASHRQNFLSDSDFILRTRSEPLERRSSASSLNFSYPSRYPIFTELQRHRSSPAIHARKSLSIWEEAGTDGPIDTPVEALTPIERSKSCNTADYSAAAFKKLHGGVAPAIDFNEFRLSGHTRPPLTSRTSSQYSRMQLHTPSYSLTTLDDQKKTTLSRRASYSSVTGISPISSVPISKNLDPLQSLETGNSSRLKVPRISLETMAHLDGNLTTPDNDRSSGSAPGSPGGIFIPEVAPFQFQAVERKRVDDFHFINTLEAATRPYTPDKFILEAAMTNKGDFTTRNPSKRSTRSFGALSRGSAGSTYASGSSIPRMRNVLKKTNPRLSTEGRESLEERGDDIVKESLELEFSNENTGCFNGMLSIKRYPTKEELSTDIPHTATTCAGPARGIIQDDNRLPLDYMQFAGQPEITLSPRDRLSKFAKESKAKYDTVSQGIKHKLVSRRTVKTKFRWPVTPEEAVVECPVIQDPVSSEAKITVAVQADSAGQSERIERDDTTGSYSLTTTSTGGQSQEHVLSTVYSESQQALRRLYNRNWGNAFTEHREQRRTYYYGTAQAKVKMYMSGARSESLTALEGFGRKIGMGSKLGEWQRAGNRWNENRNCRDKTDVAAETPCHTHEEEVQEDSTHDFPIGGVPVIRQKKKYKKGRAQAYYDGQESTRTSSKGFKDQKLKWIKAYWDTAKTNLIGIGLTKRT